MGILGDIFDAATGGIQKTADLPPVSGRQNKAKAAEHYKKEAEKLPAEGHDDDNPKGVGFWRAAE